MTTQPHLRITPPAAGDLPDPVNLDFVERLYADFARDPASVSPEWRDYFQRLGPNGEISPPRLGPSFRPTTIFNPPTPDGRTPPPGVENMQDRVDQFVRAYRVRGHMLARLDPLGRPRPPHERLEPSFYDFTEADLDRPVSSRTIAGPSVRTLRDVIGLLRDTYCRSIGVQFMHIDDADVREWLQRRMEGTRNRLRLARDEQLRILTRLTDAVIFEEFIHKKFIGAKRFSLEGAESLIPLLDLAIARAAEQGIEEIVLGMAHRGRLNVLANIVGKSPRLIFREFEDIDPLQQAAAGDVKYHLGYHGDWIADGRKVHLALAYNPSHLEFVNPVVAGRCRAKQDRLADVARERCMAIQIHGDAAFAGEGIVQETLNLSGLEAFRVGGTLHVIVNNQLGFTTDPDQNRSTPYASDVAKMLQSPIFHVNGEDPEAVATVVRLSMDFRRQFKRDVVIDMYCYRRHGHNEGDEPAFTQPTMYRIIHERKSVREGYLEHLLKLGEVTQAEADELAEHRRARLEEELSGAHAAAPPEEPVRASGLGEVWSHYRGGRESSVPEVDTAVSRARLVELLSKFSTVPPDFRPLTKIQRLLGLRQSMATGEHPLDWSTAEALAFATLAIEGTRIRLTGQDTERGTFSQRHALLHDFETGAPYAPLQHLAPDQAPVDIWNSPLSEAGVLGFEHGYSIACPDGLVLWEAQFGDFVNAAQVIVDQFIASAEHKWHSMSGLVLLLPHGFEGQGPEHSSARLERFLTLCAQDNIQVIVPTTPAQYFHALRRQVLRPWRKPLIVMTPKSLLRHALAVSSLDDLATGRFRRILPDDVQRHSPPGRSSTRTRGQAPRRVLLCSGKIYYELWQERKNRRLEQEVAIVRFEQLYPLSKDAVAAALTDYADRTSVYWVQEEPENMGAWRHIRCSPIAEALTRFDFRAIYRPASPSPATGSHNAHKAEQRQLIDTAMDV
jgi:2-oxoglutarate dehydrogenase E1 component